jgi:hypothetical protein
MKVLEVILESLKNPKTQRNVLLGVLIAVIIFFRGCGGGDEISTMEYEQNIAALQDSIRTYETKNGELVSEKLALLTDKKNLKNLNDDLAKDIKYLKDNPIVVTKFVTKIVHDTVWLEPEIDSTNITFNQDSTVKIIPFNWGDSTQFDDNNYRKIGGSYIVQVDSNMNAKTTKFSITKDEMGISFTTGITENKDNQVEIFIKSNYPGFIPTQIDGALFNPTESEVIKKYFPPKRWGVGVYGGYGFYFDPQKVTIGSGIQVGVGVSYNLFQWKGKK